MSIVRIVNLESWATTHKGYCQKAKEHRAKQSELSNQLDAEVDVKYSPRKEFQPNQFYNQKIALWLGDITKLEGDAIVNAARPSLLGGGGIDKAIHREAGPKLLQECQQLHGCLHGQTKVTSGYNLHAKYILHTVGPDRELHTEETVAPLLRSSYLTCLDHIENYNIKTVAFCCISTGAYRVPIREATHIGLKTVRAWLEYKENAFRIDKIVFAVYQACDELVYAELLPIYFPPVNNQ